MHHAIGLHVLDAPAHAGRMKLILMNPGSHGAKSFHQLNLVSLDLRLWTHTTACI